ncbi:tRNA 2-thiouridine synthesizing protein E [Salmonella enterica subsp. arizonae]|uniref:Sulfurtransferase TusE n=1 Tax=Salmonella enterica subsp. arizonae TaxID=59203 RepID=A0A379S4P2_SALER|nr:tRNA 2-thiouridine synthesizing protein E [Salmonella enterica subsp. arizonae]
MLIFEGKEISTDSEGYLKETTQWSEPLAVAIAANEGIELSANTGKSCASCANSTLSLIPLPLSECW